MANRISMRLWDLGTVRLAEGSDGQKRSWLMLFPEGEFEHPDHGTLRFTHARLSTIKRNFDQRVRKIDVALDRDHDQGQATGWVERLELRPANGDVPAGLWAQVRWTSLGVQLLADEIYRYFSPEFGSHTDAATGKRYTDVLLGGALTNRPFLKEMPAVHLSTRGVSRRPWSQVDKDCLPASCFLVVGDPARRTTWKLPVYEGAGAKDGAGRYTRRGQLNLNGVRAALDALGGARSGKPMTGVPSTLRPKLERWLSQYSAGNTGATTTSATTTAASERTARRTQQGQQGLRGNGAMTTRQRQQGANRAQRRAGAAGALDAETAEGRAALAERLAREDRQALSEFADGDDEDADGHDEDGDDFELDEGAGDDDAIALMGDSKRKGRAGTDGTNNAKSGKTVPSIAESDDEDDDSATYDDEDDGEELDEGDEDSDELSDDGMDGEDDEEYSESSMSGKSGKSGMSRRGGGSRKGVRKMSSSKKASERFARGGRGGDEPTTLAELRAELAQLREENAQTHYKLYAAEVEKTLSGWRGQHFQFRESSTKHGKTVRAEGRIALSKRFSDAYRAFALRQGIRLSEGQRHEINALIEMALSDAVVDLSSRGISYDQEARRTVRTGQRPGGAGDSDRLQEEAERIALSEGKVIDELSDAQLFALYDKAAKAIGYH